MNSKKSLRFKADCCPCELATRLLVLKMLSNEIFSEFEKITEAYEVKSGTKGHITVHRKQRSDAGNRRNRSSNNASYRGNNASI